MNNEVLTVLENCKDYIEQIKDDALAKYLVKEIERVMLNEIQGYEQYTPSFAQVIKFYKETTFEQHNDFLNIIYDKLTFFDANNKTSYEVDDEYIIGTNGTFHQINIK
jgi:hypothetical protein